MKDTCVICTRETPYDESTHIDHRKWYIEGVGQLCKSCYHGNADTTDICIPGKVVKDTPNDMELGKKIRALFSFKNILWK